MTFRLADSTSLKIAGRRVVVVVNEATEEREAFYQSSGTCGGAEAGVWCPFHGWSFNWCGLWFIKDADGRKVAVDGSWQAQAAVWLAEQDIPEAAIVSTAKVSKGSARDRIEVLREMQRAQAWLRASGATAREGIAMLTDADFTERRKAIRRDVKAGILR